MDRRTTPINNSYTLTQHHKQQRANHLLKAIIEDQHELGDLGLQLEYLLRLRGAKLITEPMSSTCIH